MKLADWAKKNNISYISAWRAYKKGEIPNAKQSATGRVCIDEEDFEEENEYFSDETSISQLLKKTAELSNNGGSVEDLAAYVITNCDFKLNNTSSLTANFHSISYDEAKSLVDLMIQHNYLSSNDFVLIDKKVKEIMTWPRGAYQDLVNMLKV